MGVLGAAGWRVDLAEFFAQAVQALPRFECPQGFDAGWRGGLACSGGFGQLREARARRPGDAGGRRCNARRAPCVRPVMRAVMPRWDTFALLIFDIGSGLH